MTDLSHRQHPELVALIERWPVMWRIEVPDVGLLTCYASPHCIVHMMDYENGGWDAYVPASRSSQDGEYVAALKSFLAELSGSDELATPSDIPNPSERGRERPAFRRNPSSPSECLNCDHPEREHVWRCVGCDQALSHGSTHPILHPNHGPGHATLFCPEVTETSQGASSEEADFDPQVGQPVNWREQPGTVLEVRGCSTYLISVAGESHVVDYVELSASVMDKPIEDNLPNPVSDLEWAPWERTHESADEWTAWDKSDRWFVAVERDGVRWRWLVAYSPDLESEEASHEDLAPTKDEAMSRARAWATRWAREPLLLLTEGRMMNEVTQTSKGGTSS